MSDTRNSATFEISAIDKTGAAFDSLINNLKRSSGSVDGLVSKVMSLPAAFGALAASLGLGAFGEMIASTIRATAELDKLHQRTGLSVGALSSLRSAARIAGTDFDFVVNSLQKMDKAMLDASLKSDEARNAFASLGVKVVDVAGNLRDPDQVLMDLALKFETMSIGAGKSAFAMQIFGKGGTEMLPVLHELAVTGEYQAKVTDRQAQMARQLEEDWKRLTASTKGIWQAFANELVPTLDALVRTLLGVSSKASGLKGIMQELAADGSLAAWAQRLGYTVAATADEFATLWSVIKFGWDTFVRLKDYLLGMNDLFLGTAQVMSGDFVHGFKRVQAGMEAMKSSWQGWKSDLSDVRWSTKYTDAFEAAIIANANFTESTDSTKVAITSTAAAAVKVADEFALLRDKIMSKDAGVDTDWVKNLGILQQAYYSGRIQLEEYVDLIRKYYGEQHVAKEEIKALQKAEEEAQKVRQSTFNSMAEGAKRQADFENGIKSEIDKLREETETAGMTAAQLIEYTAAKEHAKVASWGLVPALQAEIDANIDLKKQYGLTALAAKDYAAQTQQNFETLQGIGKNFFEQLFENGRDAFKNLGDALKKYFIDLLYQMVAKQWVVQISASLTGANAPASALASGGGSTNMLGGLLQKFGLGSGLSLDSAYGSFAYSGIGSSLGLSGASTVGAELAGSSLAGGLGAGAAGEAVGSLAGGASLTAAGSGIGSAMGALAAAAPYVAAVVAIGYALYSAFGQKKGGPKSGGYADTSSALDYDRSQHWTPNEADSTLSGMMGDIKGGYEKMVKALGGSGTADFAMGYDTDPKGTADNRLEARAMVNGQEVYSYYSGDSGLGRDSQALQDRMQLEAKRSMLAALQASDLPEDIANILNSVTASTATSSAIDDIMAFASAIADFHSVAAANPMQDALDSIQAQTTGTAGTFEQMTAAMRTLAGSYDGTLSSTQNLVAASKEYYTAEVALLKQIQQTKTALGDMFGNTIRSLTMSTLGNDDKFKFLQNEEAQLRAQMLASSNPEQIQALGTKITQDIEAAFGLLSSDEKTAQLATYTSKITALNDAIQQRLDALGGDTTSTGSNVMTQLQTAITDASKDLKTAAADSLTAANTNASTAAKGISVDVNTTFTSNVDGSSSNWVNVTTNDGGG